MSLNLMNAMIGGRLTKTPELKTTKSGVMLTFFTIAVNKYRKGENHTEYCECVAYDKTAETITKHFEKGAEILVSCPDGWETKKWQGQGVERAKTEFVANRVYFVGTRADAPKKEATAEKEEPPAFEELKADDDLPF